MSLRTIPFGGDLTKLVVLYIQCFHFFVPVHSVKTTEVIQMITASYCGTRGVVLECENYAANYTLDARGRIKLLDFVGFLGEFCCAGFGVLLLSYIANVLVPTSWDFFIFGIFSHT